MLITPRVALEVATHEALVRQAYKDSVGTWTWAVGLTSATGHKVERYIGKPQPLGHCLAIYVWALENYAEAVRAEFAGHELTEAQFAAALSFHWNTGAIQSASWPDLWKAGRIEDARASFMKWRKPPAIIPRREKEAALFFDGVWAGDGKITEYTRVTAKHTPDWSSAQTIDLTATLAEILDTSGEAAPYDPLADLAAIEAALERLKAHMGRTA